MGLKSVFAAALLFTLPISAHAGDRVLASYYGGAQREGRSRRTANGEVFSAYALTAAHRSLPFGSRVQVCFVRCAVVRINDRGPASYTRRTLDLSYGAARAIGLIASGVGSVSMEVVSR